ncbi:MAG: tetratricopeptide repeat protein [Thermodesulfobacteriota bacterium]|nr:tetratricopeptide repeat protein [Thermodesulfobacteriota bacterium]
MSGNDMGKNGYVKKETLLIVALIALVAGFISGVVFTVYKSGPDSMVRTPPQPQPPPVSQKQGSPARNRTIPTDKAQAILNLEREVAENPGDVMAWIKLGNICFDTNQPEKAIKAYNKSLELNPNNTDVWTDLGVMYRRAGLAHDAISAFERAISVDPGHQQARFNKGVILLNDLKEVDNAVKVWEELLKIAPDARGPDGFPLREMIEKIKKDSKK